MPYEHPYNPQLVTAKVTKVKAEHHNRQEGQIAEITALLGAQPQGPFDTVQERLEAVEEGGGGGGGSTVKRVSREFGQGDSGEFSIPVPGILPKALIFNPKVSVSDLSALMVDVGQLPTFAIQSRGPFFTSGSVFFRFTAFVQGAIEGEIISNSLAPVGATGLAGFSEGSTIQDGQILTLSDGVTAKNFEFDKDGAVADGFVNIPPPDGGEGGQTSGQKINNGGVFKITDGFTATDYFFEFNKDGHNTGSNISVSVSDGMGQGDVTNTIISAMVGNVGFNAAFSASSTGTSVHVTQKTAGAAGNVAIVNVSVSSGEFSVSGLSGGVAPNVMAGNVPVPINNSMSAVDVKNAFNAAVDGSVLTIATATEQPNQSKLTNTVPGDAGNVPITHNVSGTSATGMSGGVSVPKAKVSILAFE
jgi:hypothetical protein